ncbi:TetR/AcrR family transcriptional regulator [Flavobacterium sp. JP2137]|uniref:TetR/AcrR family transcriptional regulator n=1 Tax=Flavobacterium sp. JP2137 TaxID=3414510 RepID=UPI003D2FAF21
MKNDILAKAMQLFLNLGFKSVTMDDIASEMGISKKTIYQYYTSKPDLIKATVDYFNDEINEKVCLVTTLDLNAVDELMLAHSKIEELFFIKNSSPLYQLIKYYPKIATDIKTRQLQRFEHLITQNIVKGVAEGLFRADIDVRFIARLFFAGCVYLDDEDFFPNDSFSYILIQKIHLELHIRSIATPKGIALLELNLEKSRTNE